MNHYKIAALLLCLSFIQACDKTRDAFGLSRHQPDEFTTPPRSNLQAPSTSVLVPPQQGAPRRGAIVADRQAQQILNIQPSLDVSGKSSSIEENLLQNARSTTNDPNIRQRIVQETASTPQQKPFINEVLFWQQPQDPSDKVIDPHKERDETKKLIHKDKLRDDKNDEN